MVVSLILIQMAMKVFTLILFMKEVIHIHVKMEVTIGEYLTMIQKVIIQMILILVVVVVMIVALNIIKLVKLNLFHGVVPIYILLQMI